jgi:hypothetical protein
MKKVAVTDLVYFSDCRRQWWLGRKYSPKRPQYHFWVGELVHKGMETYHKSGFKVDPALASMQRFIKKSLEDLSRKFPETWQQEYPEMQDLGDLGLGIMQNYSVYDEGDKLDGKIISVEERVQVPLPEGITLSGKIDLLIERKDGLWVVDHKTAGSAYSLKGLDVDEQLTGYAYIVYKTRGVIPTGLMYNTLIKELPSEPKVLKSGKLSMDMSQKTVYDLYLSKIQEMDFDPEEYEGILSVLKAVGWSKFFTRDGSTRNLKELENFEVRAVRKAQDILAILEDPEKNAYPSPSTFKCQSCVFLGLCKAMEDGGDAQAIIDAHFMPNTYYS